jgi:signal transduction histidine kinase
VSRKNLTPLDKPVGVNSWKREKGDARSDTWNVDGVLNELGACRWSGTYEPLRAHVESPVPNRLSEFEKGGANWFTRVYPQDSARVRRQLAVAARGEASPAFEYRMVTTGASIVWVRHWWVAKRDGTSSRQRNHVQGFVQIIDERKELEAECIRAGERERHQIGQELHDDVCQVLTGLACMLELLERKIKVSVPNLLTTVHDLVSEVNEGLARTRSLAHGLVPLRLTSLGLSAALEQLAKKTITCRGIEVSTHIGRDIPPLKADQVLHLYRIAQESVGNALKHGHATKITLGLKRLGFGQRLTIRDNGIGMVPGAAGVMVDGVGMDIMRHRAFEIGAEIGFSAAAGGGTLVTVDHPGSRPSKSRRKTVR